VTAAGSRHPRNTKKSTRESGRTCRTRFDGRAQDGRAPGTRVRAAPFATVTPATTIAATVKITIVRFDVPRISPASPVSGTPGPTTHAIPRTHTRARHPFVRRSAPSFSRCVPSEGGGRVPACSQFPASERQRPNVTPTCCSALASQGRARRDPGVHGLPCPTGGGPVFAVTAINADPCPKRRRRARLLPGARGEHGHRGGERAAASEPRRRHDRAVPVRRDDLLERRVDRAAYVDTAVRQGGRDRRQRHGGNLPSVGARRRPPSSARRAGTSLSPTIRTPRRPARRTSPRGSTSTWRKLGRPTISPAPTTTEPGRPARWCSGEVGPRGTGRLSPSPTHRCSRRGRTSAP
jgi:hypothetical protein